MDGHGQNNGGRLDDGFYLLHHASDALFNKTGEGSTVLESSDDALQQQQQQFELVESPTRATPKNNAFPKQKRTRAKGEALDILKAEFLLNKKPSSKRRKELSEATGLPEKNIRIWFQNRRAKLRKSDRKAVYTTGPTSRSSSDDDSSWGLFDKLPKDANPSYYFIDACSLTVGSWNRMKSGSLGAASLIAARNLNNLSPVALNKFMSNTTDLIVLISKKNYEINYFFSAIADNTKILFRIFFPISTVANCSLTLEADDVVGETGNSKPSKLAELKLSLSVQPTFAVYFSELPDEQSTNKWSICEDFSEGKQVSDAFIGGSNIPHVLRGLQDSIKFMNSLIVEYNSTNQIIPPQTISRNSMGPIEDVELNALPHGDNGNTFFHDHTSAEDLIFSSHNLNSLINSPSNHLHTTDSSTTNFMEATPQNDFHLPNSPNIFHHFN